MEEDIEIIVEETTIKDDNMQKRIIEICKENIF